MGHRLQMDDPIDTDGLFRPGVLGVNGENAVELSSMETSSVL